jgi:hypothetical protein
MPHDQEQALVAGANAELARLQGCPLVLDVEAETLLCIVGMVQLACRHPGIADGMRQKAEWFVSDIGASFQEQGYHELAALVKAGWLRHEA